METADRDVHESVKSLGPWFHNLHLPGGIQTAPDHFLGDFPSRKWNQIEPHLPKDLSGWTALDIGCNAGFYSFELAKRGAKVLGIDSNPHYLSQARWVVERFRLENPPEFRQIQIHDLARTGWKFDLILFMGVFYHLRYPMLALDTVSSITGKLMIFQTLTMNGLEVYPSEKDYPITRREIFDEPGWPKMAFIEKKFSSDPTNWWVLNHSGVEAVLRSAGFQSINRIAHEIYLCKGARPRVDWMTPEWEAATGGKASWPQVSEEGAA